MEATTTITGANQTGTAVPLNHHQRPFDASFGVHFPDGASGNITIQVTQDNVMDPDVTPDWVSHPNGTNITANGTLIAQEFPVRAARIISDANMGANETAEFKVVQGW